MEKYCSLYIFSNSFNAKLITDVTYSHHLKMGILAQALWRVQYQIAKND